MWRACASGLPGRSLRNSWYVFAISLPTLLISQLLQVFVVPIVSDRQVRSIPLHPCPVLVAGEQHDAAASGVEGEQDPHLAPASRTRPKFLHVLVPGSHDRVNQRPPEPGTVIPEDPDRRHHLVEGVIVDVTQPVLDQLDIDLPHTTSIRFPFYTVKGMRIGLLFVHSSPSDRCGCLLYTSPS